VPGLFVLRAQGFSRYCERSDAIRASETTLLKGGIASSLSRLAMTIASEHREIFQDRNDTDDDDDGTDDLLGAAVDRKQVDQIQNKNDDKKCNQDANQQRHDVPS
jgi:hypothetical protein